MVGGDWAREAGGDGDEESREVEFAELSFRDDDEFDACRARGNGCVGPEVTGVGPGVTGVGGRARGNGGVGFHFQLRQKN